MSDRVFRHWIQQTGTLIMSAAFAMTACSTPQTGGETAPRIEVIFQGNQCDAPSQATSATWIEDPKELADLYRQLNSSRFGATPELPDIDFSRNGVLLVQMGRKNTAGYALELARHELVVQKGISHVSLNWHEPRPDALVAQVLTSPCILLSIPKGGYGQIAVADQQGDIRATASTTH